MPPPGGRDPDLSRPAAGRQPGAGVPVGPRLALLRRRRLRRREHVGPPHQARPGPVPQPLPHQEGEAADGDPDHHHGQAGHGSEHGALGERDRLDQPHGEVDIQRRRGMQEVQQQQVLGHVEDAGPDRPGHGQRRQLPGSGRPEHPPPERPQQQQAGDVADDQQEVGPDGVDEAGRVGADDPVRLGRGPGQLQPDYPGRLDVAGGPRVAPCRHAEHGQAAQQQHDCLEGAGSMPGLLIRPAHRLPVRDNYRPPMPTANFDRAMLHDPMATVRAARHRPRVTFGTTPFRAGGAARYDPSAHEPLLRGDA
jgi:hypothetical protein